MTITRSLRSAGLAIHKIMAQSRWSSRAYLTFWSTLLRKTPDSLIKRQIINTLIATRWPLIDLMPQKVRIAQDAEFIIVPHIEEFDFVALFSSELNYEKEVVSQLAARLHAYDAVIEIGANVGVYTLFFSKLFDHLKKTGAIFAFEPSTEAFCRLHRNLQLNLAKNVHIFSCAVDEYTKFGEFFEPQGHLTNGSLYASFAEIFSPNLRVSRVLTVNGEMIENLVAPDKKLLVKIDVEGAEKNVLCSLQDLIMTRKPDLVIEVLPSQEAELNTLNFLTESYTLFHITDHGLVRQNKFVADNFRDYLLLPRSVSD